METLQHKSISSPIEVKEAREDGILSIRAYGLAFGNVDSWNDIIAPNACDEFLKSHEADRMRLCWQHNTDDVIGTITAKGVDDYGMWIEADILPTTLGKDVQTLVRGGAVNELSIGYKTIRHHYDGDIRILDEIAIREVSIVTIAANPRAVITDMKAEENEPETQPAEQTEEKTLKTDTNMDEMKKQLETIEQKAAAAEKKAADLAAQLEGKETELKSAQENINNLDASVKSQQTAIEALQAQMKEQKQETFVEAVKAVLEENKEKIEKLFEEKRGGSSVRMEVKAATATTQAYGTAVDTVVGSAPHAARAFLAAFGEEVVNGDKAAWLDGTFTNNADYVEELTAAADSDASANEVIRQFGKIATRLLLSSELNDWMSEIASWAQGEALEFINDKVDAEVWNGAGNDSNAKKKIYGLKGQATAFAKLGTYTDATIADVILDAAAQAKKNGYLANVAIVSFGTEAELKGVKDKNGNYLYNQLTGMLGGIRIFPSNVVGENEILVADSRCAKVLRRPSYELEITRDADLDGWKVNVRKAAQTKVKAAHKKGLIYVADKNAAVTAISK
jgi:HK97 family phage prohead protease/HK97 family phage major capsid protein